MSWLGNFLTSSIGRKTIMSLTGLFLILFLVVHLAGNLLLLAGDNGRSFNEYASFMGHQPVIQAISLGNFFFIFLHSIQGIYIWWKNRAAKGVKYAVRAKNDTSWASKNMTLLGTLILAFILMHLGHFWYKSKFGSLAQMAEYDGAMVADLYTETVVIFTNPVWLILYLIGLLVLAIHLNHGFQSAFQTLGLRHKKYTPIIEFVGKAFSIIVPLGFAIIPLYLYFTN